jgi:hypothetical protein
MTLPRAAASVPDETATSTASVPEIDMVHLEPRCHVCRNDEVRKQVNDLLASGASYAMTLRALGDDSAEGVTSDSIRRHAERHFPVQNVAKATYREILERRAKENSVDFVEGVATAITPLAYLETVMVKGYQTLVDERTIVSHRDGMDASLKLAEALRRDEGAYERAEMLARMSRVIELVREFVPAEQWPALQARLRGKDVEQPQAQPVESIRVVDIADSDDDEGNW